MEKEPRKAAYEALIHLSEKQGYITFDNMMDYADRYALPIQDFDWLSESITSLGIITYADEPAKQTALFSDDKYNDFSQINYDTVYTRIIELNASLQPFIEAVKKIIPPQKNEVRQLKYQVAEGNKFARARMIEMYIRVALNIALQRTEAYDLAIEDTISDACIGLIAAVDKFNPDKSDPFLQYASMWILQNISRHQTTQRPLIYYPVHKKENYFAAYPILKKNYCIGCNKLIHCPKAKKLLNEELSCSEEESISIFSMMIPDSNYTALIENMNNSQTRDITTEEYLATISPEAIINEDEALSSLYKHDLQQSVSEELNHLSPREAEVLKERYGLSGTEKTLEEIGHQLGVTRERVRQIEAKAISKLKRKTVSERLKDFY